MHTTAPAFPKNFERSVEIVCDDHATSGLAPLERCLETSRGRELGLSLAGCPPRRGGQPAREKWSEV